MIPSLFIRSWIAMGDRRIWASLVGVLGAPKSVAIIKQVSHAVVDQGVALELIFFMRLLRHVFQPLN
jgi:hypothetical protein